MTSSSISAARRRRNSESRVASRVYEIKLTPDGEVSGTSIYVYQVKGGAIALIGDISKLVGG